LVVVEVGLQVDQIQLIKRVLQEDQVVDQVMVVVVEKDVEHVDKVIMEELLLVLLLDMVRLVVVELEQ
tara:strand:- start:270 stop:473 length:204 start_codon:yes stop_codon:yes gene_type:complete